jgi:hypothetical protein
MKKIAFLGFVLALGTASVLTSCSKYEEGSKFTVLSKKNRLTNDWKLSAVEDSNGASLDMIGSTTMSLDNDGTFSGNSNYTAFGQVFNFDVTGTWEFTDEKETLTLSTLTIDGLTLTSPEVSKTTIVRLAKDELKVRDEETKQVSTYIPQ